LSIDGGLTYPFVLDNSTKNDGVWSTTVNALWLTGLAKVRVSWASDPTVNDVSDNVFRVKQ
jgi:hypothetical protein